jgi:hypothetical protein
MSAVLTINERMRGKLSLALQEGGLFFERKGSIWTTLRNVAHCLRDGGVEYAISGGMAAFHHGYRCYAEDIQVVIDERGLAGVEGRLSEYQRTGNRSRRFIHRQTGVSVRFHMEGEAVGSPQHETVAYPRPSSVCELDEAISYVNLPTLLTLKLAAWSDGHGSLRDFADVQELVKTLYLKKTLEVELHPAVRSAYTEICKSIEASSGPFLLLWDTQDNIGDVKTIDELIERDSRDRAQLEAMKMAGIEIWPQKRRYENYTVLYTNDRHVAREHEMHHESEHFFKE